MLYRAADGLLPRSVLERPKQPFTLPITAMIAPGGALHGFARDVLSPAALHRHGLVEPARVDRLFDEQATRPSDRSALALWSLMIHQLWIEQFCAAPGRKADEAPALPGDGTAA